MVLLLNWLKIWVHWSFSAQKYVFYVSAFCRWHDAFFFSSAGDDKMDDVIAVTGHESCVLCTVHGFFKEYWQVNLIFLLDLAGLNADSLFLRWHVHCQQKINFEKIHWCIFISIYLPLIHIYPLFQWRPKGIKNGVCTLTQELRSLQLPVQCLYAFPQFLSKPKLFLGMLNESN